MRQRMLAVGAVVAVLLLLALGGIWWIRKSALDTEKDRLAQAQDEVAALQREKDSLSAAELAELQIDTLQGQVESQLITDISWARMLQEIARTIPNDTWLTAFQGTSSGADTAAAGSTTVTPTPTPSTTATTTAPVDGSTGTTPTTAVGTPSTTGPAAAGTVSFTVVGLDFPSVSAWIQRIGTQIPSFTSLWVPSANRGESEDTATGRDFVNFTSTAAITSAARSDRLERVQKGTR
jgi:cytoskeletal protein RodZ